MLKVRQRKVHAGWLALAVVAFVVLAALPVFAQNLDTGINTIGNNIGLGGGGGDLKILIARIIRFFLGFLGLIAVGLIMYGGYLWMTAAGNEERIRQARSVLINAGIGLVIILSAFAIASYLLRTLINPPPGQACSAGDPPISCSIGTCAGERTCSDTNGDGIYNYGGCTLFPGCRPQPPDAFVVSRYSPPNSTTNAPRNSVVQVQFNEGVDVATLTYGTTSDSVRIYPTADSSAIIAGTLDTSQAASGNRRISFTPLAKCDVPNESLSCLASNTNYTVELTSGVIRSVSGRALNCTYPSNPCKATFETGDYVDTKSPTVAFKAPVGSQVPVDSSVNVSAVGRDDYGISRLEFYDKEAATPYIGDAAPTAAPYTPFTGGVAWSTNGFTVGSTRTLQVKAFDFASHENEPPLVEKTVKIRPGFCFDGKVSGDETGLDCGGSCGACPGSSCDSDTTAPSCQPDPFGCAVMSACDPDSCICAESPVITAVLPNDGAPGNYVAIVGSGFGTTPGVVTFLGTDKDGDGNAKDDPANSDDTVAALPSVCSTAATWQDNQIIVEVPAAAVDGSVEVSTALNLIDRTNEAPGPVLPDFDVNATIRPGLCAITPSAACVNDPAIPNVSFLGKNFGSAKGSAIFGSLPGVVDVWTPTEVVSSVANVHTGVVGATIKTAADVQSNPYNFTVKSCQPGPVIDSVTPSSGPVGQVVTITGSNFGTDVGQAYFIPKAGGTAVEVSWADFPAECGPSSYWKNKQIVLKVPAGVTVADQYVYVVRRDDKESNRDTVFTVNTNTPTPGLYCLAPDNGPPSLLVQHFGDSFGATQQSGSVRYYDGNSAQTNLTLAGIAAEIKNWANQTIKAVVPGAAISGPVRVVRDGGTVSNPLQFTVGSCLVPAGAACTDTTRARVVFTSIQNAGAGDLQKKVYLGSGTNIVADGEWFPVYQNGVPINDPDIAAYRNVPGLAVQRINGEVRVVLYGGHPLVTDVEKVVGRVEFETMKVKSFRSDPAAAIEAPDSVEIDITKNRANFSMNVDKGNDGFYLTSDPVTACQQAPNICAAGFQCCGDGSCSTVSKPCTVPLPLILASYRWQFSTGNPVPRVVEEQQCNNEAIINGSFENAVTADGKISGWGGTSAGITYAAQDFLKTGSAAEGPHFYEQPDCSSVACSFASGLVQLVSFPQSASGQSFTVSLFSKKTAAAGIAPVRVYVADANDISNKLAFFTFATGQNINLSQSWQQFVGAVTIPQAYTAKEFYVVIELPKAGFDVDAVNLSWTSSSTQSPSPWKGSVDACTNAQVSVRFTTPIDTVATPKTALVVADCDSDPDCKQPKPGVSPAALQFFTYTDNLNIENGGFTADVGGFTLNHWYEARVTKAVKSDKGVSPDKDYIWRFQAKSDTCAVASLSCQPSSHKLTAKDEQESLSAGLQAANCNILSCPSGSVAWSSSSALVASVDPGLTGCHNTATAVSEGTTKVKAASPADPAARVGECRVNVIFEAPKVIEPFPSCDAACLNAAIGAVFSRPLTASTFTYTAAPVWTDSVQLYKCANADCIISDKTTTERIGITEPIYIVIPAKEETPKRYQVSFTAANGYLQKETYYRVILTKDIRSEEGKSLETNYKEKDVDGNTIDAYSWVFKTKSTICAVDRVINIPDKATLRTIGATEDIVAQPFGAPDSCNATGERLAAISYDYGWNSTDADVATITNNNVLKQIDSSGHVVVGSYVDPRQVATAVGKAPSCSVAPTYQCATDVTASVGLCTIDSDGNGAADTCDNQPKKCTTTSDCAVIGKSTLTLQCGFIAPQACISATQNVIGNSSFEITKAGSTDPLTGWGDDTDSTKMYASTVLTTGNAADGRQYYRQPDCHTTTCPFDEGLVTFIDMPYAVANQAYDFSFAVRRPGSAERVRVYLAKSDNILDKLAFVDFIGDDPRVVTTTNKWSAHSGTVTFGSAVTGNKFFLVLELPTGVEVDSVSLIPHVCAKQLKRACSTSSQCNVDASGLSLNVCGSGNPVGTCNAQLKCSNDSHVSCDNGDGTGNDLFCSFAVNKGGCCGIRPWVTSITGAESPADGTICRNAAFTVMFSQPMDRTSVEQNTSLEWLDNVGELNADGLPDCNLEESLKVAEATPMSQFFGFVRRLFLNEAGAAAGSGWCKVLGTKVLASTVFPDGSSPVTKAIISVSSLLDKKLKYRVVVHGENATDPTGGARSTAGIALDGDKNQEFPDPSASTPPGVGNHICKVDNIQVNIAPVLSTEMSISQPRTLIQPYDLFACYGDHCNCSSDTGGVKLGCRQTTTGEVPEDQNSAPGTGNQHVYQATAVDAIGQALSANYVWSKEDPLPLLSLANTTTPELETTFANKPSDNRTRFALVNVSASLGSDSDTMGSNRVPVTFMLCRQPWDNGPLQDGPPPAGDSPTNFYTTYCQDTSRSVCSNDKNKSCANDKQCGAGNSCVPELLPNFSNTKIDAPAGANQLGILAEWILKAPTIDPTHPDPDAIGVRVVRNDRHLTPSQWYAEQPFSKGAPESLVIDGYPAIRDGRTIYIGAANTSGVDVNGDGVSDPVFFTNVYIFSYNQGAQATTQNVYNQLVQNLIFNIDDLTVGNCREQATGRAEVTRFCSNNNSKACTQDSDCGSGNTCGVVKQCIFNSDCGSGYVCANTKSKVTRDVKRLSDVVNMSTTLSAYQYGSSCPAVTPGAPGDANCNGVINGYDISLTEWYRANPGSIPSYCRGADTDTDGDVDATDVSNVTKTVTSSCQRPADRTTNYPLLAAGTYVTGTSTSRWPSWVATLGNELGRQLPQDPIGVFAACEAGGTESTLGTAMLKHDSNTCWDEVSKTYASHFATLDAAKEKITKVEPPPDVPWSFDPAQLTETHVYTYSAYGRCSTTTAQACIVDSQCPTGEKCQGQGQDYALCSFVESVFTPFPALLNQVTGGDRLCLVTDTAVRDRLPAPPPGPIMDGGGTIIPPNPQLKPLQLTLTGSGGGRVKVRFVSGGSVVDTCVKPASVSATCEFAYDVDTNVLLEAVLDNADFSLGGWGGACSGQSACSVVMSTPKIVTQSFRNVSTLQVLNSSEAGDATVVVTASSGRQTCASINDTCSLAFDANTSVDVEIFPKVGSTFGGWVNSCTGVENGTRCEGVTVTRTVTLQVNLTAAQPTAELSLLNGTSYIDGALITVSWTTTNATDILLTSDGNVADRVNMTELPPNGSSTVVAKMGMTTLTLTATGPGGTTTKSVSFTVNVPSGINNFIATPSLIQNRDCSDLTWTETGAAPTTRTITVHADDGSLDRTISGNAAAAPVHDCPSNNAPTNITYTLNISGPGESASATTTLAIVKPAKVTKFEVAGPNNQFGASADVVAGDNITFRWETTDATSGGVAIDQGVGVVTPEASGTKQATASTSQTYKITATGRVGAPDQKSVTVTVHQAPSVTLTPASDPSASSVFIDPAGSETLNWNVTPVADFVRISSFTNVPPASYNVSSAQGSVVVSLGADTSQTYTITVQGYGSLTATDSVTVSKRPTVNLIVSGSGLGRLGYATARGTGNCTNDPSSSDPMTPCSFNPNPGDAVVLLATPNGSAQFTGWTNCPSATGNRCNFSASAAGGSLSVTATFEAVQQLTLQKIDNTFPNPPVVNGNVVVESAPAGWPTPTANDGVSNGFTENYLKNSSITLRATSVVNSGTFQGWGGACTSAGASPTCTISMTGEQTVTAKFVTKPQPVTLFVIGPQGGNCNVSNRGGSTVINGTTYSCTVSQYNAACLDVSAPCAPNSLLAFTWGGGTGASSYEINPGSISGITGTRWPASGTKQIPGSGAYTVTAVNGVGQTVSNSVDIWIAGWPNEDIAATNVTATYNDGTSPRAVFSSATNGYLFYTGKNNTCQYVRGTRGGTGFTWAASVDIAANCRHIVSWYDQWTPAPFNTGSLIHLGASRAQAGGNNANTIQYSTLNTVGNTLTTLGPTGVAVGIVDAPQLISATKAVDGKNYFTLSSQVSTSASSFSDQCPLSSNACSRITNNPYPETDNEAPQLVPLASDDATGKMLLYHYNSITKTLNARVWVGPNATSSWGSEQPVLTAAENVIMTGYAGDGFSAVTNPTTGESIVAYRQDQGVVSNDDFIALKRRTKSSTFGTVVGSNITGVAGGGFQGVALALDSRSGYLYIAYAERTTTQSTTTIKYRRSVLSTNDPTWVSAGWTAPIPVITVQGDYHGLTLNYLSRDIIYASAVDASTNRLRGAIVNILTPPSSP
ncbi:MAG: Ig-like domain-containing protein [Patescibacteria group bacterium]|jgi:hypothetical protein